MREYPVSVNMTITPCASLAACQVGQWSLQSCPLSFAIYTCFSLSMLDGLEARLACAGMVQQIRSSAGPLQRDGETAVVADDGVACCAVEVQLNEICVVSVVDARDVLTRHRHRIISQT